MSPIYLDNAATTQPLPSVKKLCAEYVDSMWQNPSALYREAVAVRAHVEEVRRRLTTAFGTGEHRCLFTSGGTEGANMAVLAGVSRRRNGNYVCSGFEHPCVEESFRAAAAGGAAVRFAPVEKSGRTDNEALLSLVDEDTVLVSCMHVNNETGALNDVEALAAAVKRRNPRTLVHVDGVQAFLRHPVRDASNIDYYTVSAHKVHALKGTGALFYRQRTPLKALLHGGGQEQNLRSGTENTLGILALGAAAEYFAAEGDAVRRRLAAMTDMLRQGLAGISGSVLLTDGPSCSHITAVSFPGLRGETLMHVLEDYGVTVSTGSACSSHKGRSRAARVLGIPEDVAQGTVRVSLGALNTEQEVEQFLQVLPAAVYQLRSSLGV